MDELLADFIIETREMLEALESEVIAWEAEPADRDHLDNIFRFFHTVKGNCGFFDLPRLERLSHAAESALSLVRSGEREAEFSLVEATLAIIDRIAEMVAALETGEPLDDGVDAPLIAALDARPSADHAADETGAALQVHSPTGKKASSALAARTIRVPVALLDHLMSGVSDMVYSRNDLARQLRDSGQRTILEGPFSRLSIILDDLRGGVTQMRMQQIGYLFSSLPRLVRDLSAELGKPVDLQLEGGDVEMDREMIESIRDPLVHVIRNAIDHGIEPPSERAERGKPAKALLKIVAHQDGNRITLTCSDDGRGLSLDKIASKAAASGLVAQEDIADLDEAAIRNFIFVPGLSTAQEVSGVSGRGVGMDVVRANIERVGGTIEVESEEHAGCAVKLQIPLTLSIIAGLTVSCGGRRFAVPRQVIEEVAKGTSPDLDAQVIGDRRFVTMRGERTACIALSDTLGVEPQIEAQRAVYLFVRLDAGHRIAFIVDRVLDNEDLVVKPLSPPIAATGIYAGSTQLDDGEPVLILDLLRIATTHAANRDELPAIRAPRTGENVADVAMLDASELDRISECLSAQNGGDGSGDQALLFEDIAGVRCAIMLDDVLHIHVINEADITFDNGQGIAALDGVLYPLVGLDGTVSQGRITALKLTGGGQTFLYAATKIIDTVNLPRPSDQSGEAGVKNRVLIEGKSYRLVDNHQLSASQSFTAGHDRQPTCAVPQGDDWSRSFLTPLLENAGFEVLDNAALQKADIEIVLDTDQGKEGKERQVRLHSDPDAPNLAGSAYRYDRVAVLGASFAALRNV